MNTSNWITSFINNDILYLMSRYELDKMLNSSEYTDTEKEMLKANVRAIKTDEDGVFYNIPEDYEEKFNLDEGINIKATKELNLIMSKEAFLQSEYADPTTYPNNTLIQLFL